jgi:hypothetical protein
MHERRIGEVVETSTVQFVVECDELDRLPELGSFVRVGGTDVEAIYGIVAYAETTAVDPGRRVVRRGSGEIQDRALYEANPELRFVLRSLFVAVAIAHERSGRLFFLLPPCPPPLHYSVERVPAEEVWRLTDSCRYFSFLLAVRGEVPAEQFLAAHLSYVFRARGNDERWLEGAAQELARLLKRDYDRLRQVLEAVEPLIEPRPH